MKKTFRKAMISTICMLVVAIMSLTGVTYAWFSQGTSANVSNISLGVEATTGGVLIAESLDGTYASTLDFTDKDLLAEGAKLAPVSTVGGTDEWAFFAGAVNAANASQIQTSAATANSQYVRKSLYLKNDGAAEVVVNLGADTEKRTNISEGGVEGSRFNGHLASRLGVRYVATTSTVAASEVTEGNVNVLNGTGDTTNEGYAILEPNATTHLSASYNGKLAYNGVQGISSGYFGMDDTTAAETGEGAKPYLAAVSTVADTTKIQITVPAQTIVQIEVYIWLEGQDVDCTNAVSQSVINAQLYFDKVAAQ